MFGCLTRVALINSRTIGSRRFAAGATGTVVSIAYYVNDNRRLGPEAVRVIFDEDSIPNAERLCEVSWLMREGELQTCEPVLTQQQVVNTAIASLRTVTIPQFDLDSFIENESDLPNRPLRMR